jgi:hypothetical protein
MFPLGQIVISPGAKVCLEDGESDVLLDRHIHGDYGDIPLVDQCINDQAIIEKAPITSYYRSRKGFEIVVSTDGFTRICLVGEDQNVRAK